MVILPTQIDPGSADFRANRDFMLSAVQELKERQERVRLGGGQRAVELHC